MNMLSLRSWSALCRHLPVFALVLTSMCSIGCDGGYQKPLGKSFYLHRSADSIVLIFRNPDADVPQHPTFAEMRFDIVIGARVTRYAVLDDAIVGFVEDRPESPYAYLAMPGWFWIDRQTGEVRSELSKQAWASFLAEHGIDADKVRLLRAR